EGYRIEQPSPFAVGNKGEHTALIMCNPAPSNMTWVNIVVASNSEGGGVERQRLQARMEGQTPPQQPAQPPVTQQPPALTPNGTGREGCQASDWSLRLEQTTVQRNKPIVIHFTSKGRMNDRDWVSIYPVGGSADKYVIWGYAVDASANCTFTTYVSTPG